MLAGFLTLIALAAHAADSKFPFYVYKDKPYRFNHFSASGFMPDGKCVAMNDAWTKDCGGDSVSCIKADFDRDCTTIGGQGWAGVFWLYPSNNWGDMKTGYKLTGAKKLVFSARGEKGGEAVTFKMGGVGMGHQYPDSDTASSDPIVLTKDWKEYTIDLTGKDLSHVIGGFGWVGTAKENQSNATFYLKDIYYAN
jgi:hypothetical protein